MNPNEEFRLVVADTITEYFGEEHDLSHEVFYAVRDWMGRNGIIFYQP